MARANSIHVCSACGHQTARWAGRCPGCGEWNTLVEEVRKTGPSARGRGSKSGSRAVARPVALRDVAAAAESARAAAATARVNVEINLAGITDEQASLEMIAEIGKADDIIALAERVTAAVREQIRA